MADGSPIVSGIAGRYASALFELASEAKNVDSTLAELQSFDGMIASSTDLERLIRSPVFGAEDQVRALSAVLAKAGIGGLTANFLKLLASKRRLFVVRDAIRAFGQMADEKKGVVRAQVTVAEPLSDKNRKALVDALKSSMGNTVDITEKVDPAIIGGIIVQLGSRMVDSSVRTKLNSIKTAMKEVG